MASVTKTDQPVETSTSLTLAFCLYKYFPYGGLQRDFLRIARECQRRGHQIRVYTLSWRGGVPDGFDVITVPVEAITNHARYERFVHWVRKAIQADPVDGVIGINKMPGLDVYYAADSCYEEKAQSQRNWLYRLLPRYRHFRRYEQAVFAVDSRTEILMISEAQETFFKKYYRTPSSRLRYLVPGISRDRIAPADSDTIRFKKRAELGIANDEFLLLMVGSGFIKKGLKRAIYGMSALPASIRAKTRFIVVGDDNPAPFKRLLFLLGLRHQVSILSGRDDVPELLLAADLLLHPALDENAGIILLEAIVAGLPVLATDVCGYGHYIEESGMGYLLPAPYAQSALNDKLLDMIQANRKPEWQLRAKQFSEVANIYRLPEEATDVIEEVVLQRFEERHRHPLLAFCLYKYFPFGGLQRDFVRIAQNCQDQGCSIKVYTLEWSGAIPAGFEVVTVPVEAITNHERYQRFSDWVQEDLLFNPAAKIIGFNKMPGLDIYYAADSCYEEKARAQRGWLYRQSPRYHHFSAFEKAVFSAKVDTKILMISEVQKPLFVTYYGTQPERFELLPPGIGRDRAAPADAPEIRAELRREFGLEEEELLMLMVGSGFITKGLDRILQGLASLPTATKEKTRLMVIGQDAPGPFRRMAVKLGISDRVEILKGRSDIPRFLLGADLLVHPAYVENTGTVILEAIVAGLPVLVTDICGYAHYVTRAGAGEVLPSPYEQADFNRSLASMLISDQKAAWKSNALAFSKHADIYSMPRRAADYIVSTLDL